MQEIFLVLLNTPLFKFYYVGCPFGQKTQIGYGNLNFHLKENTLQNFFPVFLKSHRTCCAVFDVSERDTWNFTVTWKKIICGEVYCMYLNGFKSRIYQLKEDQVKTARSVILNLWGVNKTLEQKWWNILHLKKVFPVLLGDIQV